MKNLTLSINDLYEELKEIAFNEGAFSSDEWDDLAESLIEEKRGMGEIDDDFNWVGLTEALKFKYEDFNEEVAVM